MALLTIGAFAEASGPGMPLAGIAAITRLSHEAVPREVAAFRLVHALHCGEPARHDSLLQEPRLGDRYLLGSDGLHAVVPHEVLRTVHVEIREPSVQQIGLEPVPTGNQRPLGLRRRWRL